MHGMEDLENAEDYETVINGIRGDTAPIEQRYPRSFPIGWT